MKPQVSKEIAVTALITNEKKEILIIKPSYKEGWILPGGYVEIGESPCDAIQREIEAELGVTDVKPGKLLCVDYHSHTSEYIMFVFDGGVFTDATITDITLPPRLVEFKFVSTDEALQLLRANSARRLLPALEAKEKENIAYLEQEENPFFSQ